MMDVNQLFLLMMPPVDEVSIEPMGFSGAANFDEKAEGHSEGQDDLKPESFIFFMAQTMTPIPPEVRKLSESVPFFSQKEEPTPQMIEASQEDSLKNEPEETVISVAEDAIQNNVALTWIDSKTFQPPNLTHHLGLEDLAHFEKNHMEPNDSSVSLAPEMESLRRGLDAQPMAAQVFHPIADQAVEGAIWADEFVAHLTLDEVNPNEAQYGDIGEKETEGMSFLTPLRFLNMTPMAPKPLEGFALTSASYQSIEIPVQLNHPEWADQLSEQIIWLGQQEIKSALIKINPEELGPIEMHIKVIKNTASLSINSHSSEVCEILDQSMPRLKEMMSEQGLQLSDVQIGSDARSSHFSHSENQPNNAEAEANEETVQATPVKRKLSTGLVDYFA